MPTYAEMIEDNNGDLVDIKLYCSEFCYVEGTGKSAQDIDKGSAIYPCPEATDYDQHCASCDKLMVAAIDPAIEYTEE